MTTITKNKVVHIHYTLKNDDGDIVDSSQGNEPLAYLHGAGNIVVGLENALEGRSIGDALNVIVKPEEGYGLINDNLIQEVDKARFGDDFSLKAGDKFHAQTPQGLALGLVVSVKDETVCVDFNHELAGKTLYFDIDIQGVRDASEEEIDHGHAHGPGGHQH